MARPMGMMFGMLAAKKAMQNRVARLIIAKQFMGGQGQGIVKTRPGVRRMMAAQGLGVGRPKFGKMGFGLSKRPFARTAIGGGGRPRTFSRW